MNYSRFSNRNPQQPQERNLASDIHDFMEGLGKIAQIMYTSVPVIEFIKIAMKYSWKFCEYLGTSSLSSLGAIKLAQKPEVVLEILWNKPPIWKSLAKFSSVLAISIIIFCLLFSKPDLDEEWNKTSDTEPRPPPEVKSVEDKIYPEEIYDDYPDYPIY
jgi:hypothetical protein